MDSASVIRRDSVAELSKTRVSVVIGDVVVVKDSWDAEVSWPVTVVIDVVVVSFSTSKKRSAELFKSPPHTDVSGTVVVVLASVTSLQLSSRDEMEVTFCERFDIIQWAAAMIRLRLILLALVKWI